MFKFHQNRLSGFRDVGNRNMPFLITAAVDLYKPVGPTNVGPTRCDWCS